MDGSEEPDQRDAPVVPALKEVPRPIRRAILGRVVLLTVALVALYVLWPGLLKVFSAWPELLRINPVWFVVMLACEAASFVCMWSLQRLALQTDSWFGVATSQLAGNALSRVVPGGAAAGAAVQYRMLAQTGVDPAAIGTGLTASTLIGTTVLLALPVLTIPAVLAGRPVPRGLSQAALLGGVVFLLAFTFGAILLTRDGPLRRVGAIIQWTLNRIRRHGPPTGGLPYRIVAQRDAMRDTLGKRWWIALLSAMGNSLLDYLALLAALTAVGSRPRPSLVLLAYVAAMVLGMIPITPGGLGFVEAGLTGMLALAGVSAPDAVLATLAYRLVAFWLPLPTGLVAASLHRRRLSAHAAAAC